MTDLFPTNLSDGLVRTAPGGPKCARCGSTPAANVTFRKHTGMLLFGRTEAVPGPFCRDCGQSWFRAMTAQTLAIGWFGPTSFVLETPIVIVRNLLARRKVMRLGPPVPPPNRRPFSPGRPLFLRIESAVILIPIAFIAFLVAY